VLGWALISFPSTAQAHGVALPMFLAVEHYQWDMDRFNESAHEPLVKNSPPGQGKG